MTKPLPLHLDLNPTFSHAFQLMDKTREHLFITGKAGTGKSTLLDYFMQHSAKRAVMLAPTGVAALNIRGQTIHRFFNFYVDVNVEKINSKQIKPRNKKLFQQLETIVVDEVSMLRADLLDCMDAFLRLYGPQPGTPFGGVQMVFVGDLYQLPPVISSAERTHFEKLYKTPYFFSARAITSVRLTLIEFDHVYRQKDQDFIDLLNRIRVNNALPDDIALLNQHLRTPSASDAAGQDDVHITLTTTNARADEINEKNLLALPDPLHTSAAEISGVFTKDYYPTAPDLRFKRGAQIMMLNNDQRMRWVNGSLGVITDIGSDIDGNTYVRIRLHDEHKTVDVYPFTWEVYQFHLVDDVLVSEPVGTFAQFPFRLAWAVTIHKSQGKTFSHVVIDLGRGAFAAGQVYVALSRCTHLEGIELLCPLTASQIKTDPIITKFMDYLKKQEQRIPA